jgi:ribonuclease P protein component
VSEKRFGITPQQRLRSSRDFAAVYDGKQRAGDEHVLLFGRRNETGVTRFGLSVSKKHGHAVRRARLKRLLREAFRLEQHRLPAGVDLVIIPRQDSGATRDDYRRSLVSTARRLSRRLAPPEQTEREAQS